MRPNIETQQRQKQKDQMFSPRRIQNSIRFASDIDSGVSSNASSSLTINTCVPQCPKDKSSPREINSYYRPRGQTISSRVSLSKPYNDYYFIMVN